MGITHPLRGSLARGEDILREKKRNIIPRKNIFQGTVLPKRFEGGRLCPERIPNEENYSL